MKRSRVLLIAATGGFAGWMLAAPAQAQAPSDNPAAKQGSDAQPSAKQDSDKQPTPTVSAGQLMVASAKVEKVDVDKHELTLKDKNDKSFTINVPEDVNRLDNVKPGDRLQVSFYESVAVSLTKPGEATVGQEKTTATKRAPGALPGGAMAQQITTTAKITKIAPSRDELTIEGPGGKANTIKVEDPDVRTQLSRLRVGDKVQTTYTQAMATRVTPARSM
jgi:hypothetical protein